MNKVWPTDPTYLIKSGSLDDINHWISHGGDLDYVDAAQNTIPHLLAIGRTQKSTPYEVRPITKSLFQYYSQEQMEKLSVQSNGDFRTPWHELSMTCKASSTFALHSAGVVIAEEMINAGASPLIARSPEKPEDFPAVSILPRIAGCPQLIRKLIEIDSELTLGGEDGNTPPHLSERYPTLLWAAINQKQYSALRHMLIQGAEYSDESSPVHPLMRDIRLWHIDRDLRACGRVLWDQNRLLPSNEIHADLMTALDTWEKQLTDAEKFPQPPQNRREVLDVKESLEILLKLTPHIDRPLEVLTSDGDKRTLGEGLLGTLEKSYPRLYQTACKIPEIIQFPGAK